MTVYVDPLTCECGCGTPPAYPGSRFCRGHNRRKDLCHVVNPKTGCWIWPHSRNGAGYGTMWCEGRGQMAHRVYYEREHGPIPEGMTIDHLCYNRLCVNPAHLELVTMTINNRRSRRNKLTADLAGEIRALHEADSRGPFSTKALAALYGVHPSTIRFVVSGRTWQEAF